MIGPRRFEGAIRLRSRAGSSLTEVLVASVLLGAGLLPLSGHWVKLTRDTGAVTGKAHAFQQVREALDRYRGMGLARLVRLAGPGGLLPDLGDTAPGSTVARAGGSPRMAAALGLTQAAWSSTDRVAADGTLPVRAYVLAAVSFGSAGARTETGVTERAPCRLRVESATDRTICMESLVETAGDPTTPAWE